MLFREKLDEISHKLSPEFDRLFNRIQETQTHIGDLLLVQENGIYKSDVHTWNNLPEKMSPYMIGPDHEGISFNTHYNFIHTYRTNAIAKISLADYHKDLVYSSERREEIDQLQEIESQSIQLEMLIYLKIWETDFFIKRFYQIARLLHGEPYDWHFKIAESNRDEDATGNRQTIIRKKIRDNFKDEFPIIFDAFKIAYNTQIRNSIAHSKYSITGRTIGLNNYIKEDKASQLRSISFDNWIDIFTNTMIIYNEQIGFIEKSKKHYLELSKKTGNIVEVRINRKDPEEKTEFHHLKHRQVKTDLGRWAWLRPDEKT